MGSQSRLIPATNRHPQWPHSTCEDAALRDIAHDRAETFVSYLNLYGPLLAAIVERPGDNASLTAQNLKANSLRTFGQLRKAVERQAVLAWPQWLDISVLNAITDQVCDLWRCHSRMDVGGIIPGYVAAYEQCDRSLLRFRTTVSTEMDSMANMRVANMLATGSLVEKVLNNPFAQDRFELAAHVGKELALSANRAAMRFCPLPAGEPHQVVQLHVLLVQGAKLMSGIWRDAVETYGDVKSAPIGEEIVRDIFLRWARSNTTMIALAEADALKVLNGHSHANSVAQAAALSRCLPQPQRPSAIDVWGYLDAKKLHVDGDSIGVNL